MRKIPVTQQVALLATGDEITHGDILNTNSQQIALRLTQQQIHIGMHLVCSDNIDDIEQSIRFLLQSHKALIITGGLGPTSDDLTRYALARVVEQPLVFDEKTWEYICQRLSNFGYLVPPESNRQQALFPSGATIIPNPNGTAAGCWIRYNNLLIFMLPGPPNECLPMIDKIILPALVKAHFQQSLYGERWLLFGASEGKIAEELDAITQPFGCVTGYRLCHPYLEFKIICNSQESLAKAIPLIEKTIQPYVNGNGKQAASEELKFLLEKSKRTLGICDLATGGLLENILKTPPTSPHVFFSSNPTLLKNNTLNFYITGLDEFWQAKPNTTKTQLKIEFHDGETIQTADILVPLRADRVKSYAVEWISQQILKWLNYA